MILPPVLLGDGLGCSVPLWTTCRDAALQLSPISHVEFGKQTQQQKAGSQNKAGLSRQICLHSGVSVEG